MRTPNLGTAFYQVGEPPNDPAELSRFLRDELQKISGAVQALALGHLDVTTVAPSKPRKGNIRYADGTLWNPGSGEGVYRYNGTSWISLG